MDPILHTLTGWTLARAGAERLGPYTTPLLMVAANVPDIGVLHFAAGPAAFLQHASWTHSIIGAGTLGAGTGWVFWRWGRRRTPMLGRRNLILAGVLGAISHLLLDWVTPAGAALLWPARSRYYGLDWFAMIDVLVLAFLLLGLALPALFGLISEEIGARRSRGGVRWAAWLALVAFIFLGAGRATLHESAVTQLDARLYQNRVPLRVAAFPSPLSPFRWRAVAETAETFELADLSVADRYQGLRAVSTRFKPQPSPLLDAALATPSARAFLPWARFPLVEVVPAAGGGYQVDLQDLRDARQRPALPRFTARIELNQEGEVETDAVLLAWGDD